MVVYLVEDYKYTKNTLKTPLGQEKTICYRKKRAIHIRIVRFYRYSPPGMSVNYSAFDTKNAFPTCGVPL